MLIITSYVQFVYHTNKLKNTFFKREWLGNALFIKCFMAVQEYYSIWKVCSNANIAKETQEMHRTECILHVLFQIKYIRIWDTL